MKHRFSRGVRLLLACMVAATVAAAAEMAASADASPRVYFGAWVGEKSNIPGDIDAFERAVGKKLSIIHRYSMNPPYTASEHFNASWADDVRARGAIPMVSWGPNLNSTTTLEKASQGAIDDFIRTWARELKAWGHPLFFRMMWEQNAPWYPWGAVSEPRITQYKTLWKRIVTIFRAEGASKVTFVWSPHTGALSTTPIMQTYPGDYYVNWVALDGYPYRAGRGNFYITFKPEYDELGWKTKKPLMIAETSFVNDSDSAKAALIKDALTNQLPNNFPRVKALVWFDEKDTNGVVYSILTEQGPLSRQAFAEGIASSYYGLNGYGNLDVSPIPIPELAGGAPPPGSTPTVTPTPTLTPTPSPTPSPTASPTPSPTPGPPPGGTTPISQFADNLVTNPSFEAGSTGGMPTGWTLSGSSGAVAIVESPAYSGSRSLRNQSAQGHSYSLFQEVRTAATQKYGFEAYVNVASTSGYFSFDLQLQAMNVNGGLIKTIPVASVKSTTGGWRRVQMTSIALPTGTTKTRVVLKANVLKGTVYIDDVVLVPEGIPLP